MRIMTLCMMAAAVCTAGEAVQTDWSGGWVVVPFVETWGDSFLQSEDISFSTQPGRICLLSVPMDAPLEQQVNPSVTLAGLACGDLNTDGRVDLVGASLNDGGVFLFENIGGGQWETTPLDGALSGALGCDVADMDGDGYADVLGAAVAPDAVLLWWNQQGAGPLEDPVVVDPLLPGVHCVAGCDIDGDGLMDLMAAANECDQIVAYYGLDGASWQKVVIDSAFAGTQSVAPADFNGDGYLDAAGAALGAGEFAWWENPGNRTDPWQKHLLADSMAYPHHAAATDLNSDGLPDFIGCAYGSGDILWWENDGTPSGWVQRAITLSLPGVLTSAVCDFDGDGDQDVAGAGWNSDRVVWFENADGTATEWTARTVDNSFNGAWPLCCADFDDDGGVDLAAGADVLSGPGSSHGPSVYDLCSFVDEGSLTSSILDLSETPQWASFQSTSETSSSTTIDFYWRGSDDYQTMGEWIGPSQDMADLSGEMARYVQYRVRLSTTNTLVSPQLFDIQFYWDPNGCQAGECTGVRPLVLQENPSHSGMLDLVLIRDRLDVPAELTLYDMGGRLIDRSTAENEGEMVVFGPLPSGQYFIRCLAQGSCCTVKGVVIK